MRSVLSDAAKVSYSVVVHSFSAKHVQLPSGRYSVPAAHGTGVGTDVGNLVGEDVGIEVEVGSFDGALVTPCSVGSAVGS